MASLEAVKTAPASVDDRVRAVVRALLSAYDMTRKDLAVAVGMTENQLGDRRRGSRFRVEELVMIADYFDMPLSAFVAGPDALMGRSNPLDTRTVSIKNRPNAPAYPARHHPRTTRTLALCPSAA